MTRLLAYTALLALAFALAYAALGGPVEHVAALLRAGGAS